MRIGVDYYPEQWNPQFWQEDADRMAETGVKVVRLAEFAWSVLEPRQDQFEFDWLDTIIRMFTVKGIQIVLCTPTNCPPLWLYEAYPDAVQTGTDGNPIAIGVRGHRCYRSPAFLQRMEIIIDQMVSRYKDNSHVIAWQIDNELEANFCRCPNCQEGFRNYLQEKYQTLEEMNRCYGNTVWSGSYSDWSQVKPPMGSYAKGWYNPGLMLDYHRFAAADTERFVQHQLACIRKHCPDIPVTTNTWFCENHVDFHKLFRSLDFVSYDNYPALRLPQDAESLHSHAFHLDFMRGIKRQNFWIMEQLSGGMGSWSPMSQTTSPGMIKGYALQAFAHGADTIVHFRWRTAVQGAEMFWHGLIDHSNIPGRRFEEFTELCSQAEALSDIANSAYVSRAAILYDTDTDFALNIQPQTDGFHYLQQLKLWHDACLHCGVNTDIISADASLEGYSVVIAPALYITHPGTAEALHAYVQGGGTLILTLRSGVKDACNSCIMDALPTVYRDMTGAYAEEYNPIGWEQQYMEMDGKTYRISQWCDILRANGTKVIASYQDGFYAGKPAVTKNAYGKGYAYYVGTAAERQFYQDFMRTVFTGCGTDCIEPLPLGIEVTTREDENTIFRFIFNNTDKTQHFSLNDKEYTMQPFEMAVERIAK